MEIIIVVVISCQTFGFLQIFQAGNLAFFFLIHLFFIFIYFWLCWVFAAVRGLSLVAARGATLRCSVQASHCGDFSCGGAQALGAWASVVVVHRLSCSAACGIFPDQGLNPCPLRWQEDS